MNSTRSHTGTGDSSPATRQSHKFLSLAFALLLAFAPTGALAQGQKPEAPKQATAAATEPAKPATGPQQIVREGIAVEFDIEPASGAGKEKSPEVMEGEDARVKFKVTDTTTKAPVANLNLSAWMTGRENGKVPTAQECREKIQSFLQGSLRSRPDVDLNAYYVLALNQEPNISVIDPLLGFGGSKLYTLVMLKSPGEDWALTSDRQKLFVTMPLVNQVAVVDTNTWKVIANVDTGLKPTRIALQPDEKYVWVGNDGATASEKSGVTAIDTATLKAAGQVETGSGHHELAFSSDSRYAFVTNREDGTLSVVDVQKLAKTKDIKTGALASSITFSTLSNAAYVTSEAEGTIAVVDGRSHQILTRINAKPGLRSVRLAPGGRWGFVVNNKENLVHIFDASTNRLVQSAAVGADPIGVTFTDAFAYVQANGTEEVRMIRLSTVGKELDIVHFPGGQVPPGRAQSRSIADTIVPAPEGNSVLVANTADRVIYYYSEGMAAPMGNFQNYKRDPRAVMVVDRSLREISPGMYVANVRLPRSGAYDVAFLADSPRITHCFETSVKVNPAIQKQSQVALKIEHLIKERTIRPGQEVSLRFKLTDTASGQPRDGLKDVRVLTFLAPGIWQKRDFARSLGGGVYEVTVNVPQTGVYFVFVECPSLGVAYRQLPHLILTAADAAPAAGKQATGSGNE